MSDVLAQSFPNPGRVLAPPAYSAVHGGSPKRVPAAGDSAPVSWLIGDVMDRERMLDMDRMIAPVRRKSFVVMAVALLLCGPWLGWWTILLLAVAGVLFALADKAIERVRRPEYLLFTAWAGSQLMITLACVLTGGPHSPAMAWFAIPIVTLSARFPTRGVILGVAVTVVMIVGVGFATGAEAIIDHPPLLIMPLALATAVAILSTALMSSDITHRSEAVIDPLTGMLNRNSLKDRTFDLAYRIGGEEFLVLLPGANLEQTAAMAERLRLGVQADTVGGGLRVTMSFGVSASARDAPFDYQSVCEEADAALYEAKRHGRNRVCSGAAIGPAALPAVAA